MKENIKGIILLTVIIISLVIIYPLNTYAISDSTYLTPSKSDRYNSYDYVIDKYDINVMVHENNTFDVIETIDTYFNIPKHGIFRTIPRMLKN